jgi:hypothetical protein
VLDEGPSPSLKELVLDLSISVKAFRSILSGVRSPIIERIGVTTTLVEERSSVWVSAEWDECLVELSKDGNGGLFFAGFESLTQLLLPCDGVSPKTLVSHRPLRFLLAMLFFDIHIHSEPIPLSPGTCARPSTSLLQLIRFCQRRTDCCRRVKVC